MLIRRWLVRRPRFDLYFIPTSASGINLGERWFTMLTEKHIRRGVHRSTREIATAVLNYIKMHNRQSKPFVWTKTADEILASVSRSCQRIFNSGQ